MKEQLSEQQEMVINEAVDKINEFLPYPKSLLIDHITGEAIYTMASGMIDESGGGSVHDVDYYTFPAEGLDNLIINSSASKTKITKTEVKGYRFTDYVDWPYGRVDGSEFHRENTPVLLNLGYKKGTRWIFL